MSTKNEAGKRIEAKVTTTPPPDNETRHHEVLCNLARLLGGFA